MPPALNTSNGGGATLQSNVLPVCLPRAADMNLLPTIDAPQETAVSGARSARLHTTTAVSSA